MDAASAIYGVHLEERPVPRSSRIAKGIARVLGALMDQGRDPGFGDVSPTLYRVIVTDRSSGRVVHEEDWGGEQAGAQEALRRISSDLAHLDVEAFESEYAIR